MKLLTFLLLLRAAREEFHQVDCALCCCFLYGSLDPSSVFRRRLRCRLLNGFAVCLRRLHRLLFGAAALILSMSSYIWGEAEGRGGEQSYLSVFVAVTELSMSKARPAATVNSVLRILNTHTHREMHTHTEMQRRRDTHSKKQTNKQTNMERSQVKTAQVQPARPTVWERDGRGRGESQADEDTPAMASLGGDADAAAAAAWPHVLACSLLSLFLAFSLSLSRFVALLSPLWHAASPYWAHNGAKIALLFAQLSLPECVCVCLCVCMCMCAAFYAAKFMSLAAALMTTQRPIDRHRRPKCDQAKTANKYGRKKSHTHKVTHTHLPSRERSFKEKCNLQLATRFAVLRFAATLFRKMLIDCAWQTHKSSLGQHRHTHCHSATHLVKHPLSLHTSSSFFCLPFSFYLLFLPSASTHWVSATINLLSRAWLPAWTALIGLAVLGQCHAHTGDKRPPSFALWPQCK